MFTGCEEMSGVRIGCRPGRPVLIVGKPPLFLTTAINELTLPEPCRTCGDAVVVGTVPEDVVKLIDVFFGMTESNFLSKITRNRLFL